MTLLSSWDSAGTITNDCSPLLASLAKHNGAASNGVYTGGMKQQTTVFPHAWLVQGEIRRIW